MKYCLIVAGALAFAPAVHAEAFISGSQLAKACAATSRDAADCSGFIAGALDEIEANAETKNKMCLPAGIKLRTLRESLASYVQERPDSTKGSGVALLNAMVSSRFPCKS